MARDEDDWHVSPIDSDEFLQIETLEIR